MHALTPIRFLPAFAALCVAAASFVPCAALAADEPHIATFSAAPAGDPPTAWRFATLPHKQPTKFSIVELGGTHVLKVEADDSYGNLVHGLHTQIGEHATLSWRWRVDQLLADADLKSKSGDDSPAKVCVFFAFDVAKLSLGERTRLSLAHSVSGEEVPSESLCYVWDNKLPVDTALPNAFTKRIRMIVLQSGETKRGEWIAQKRDIVADYQRVFGDESGGQVPEVIGVAISADGDNTHEKALAYFGDVVLTP